MYVFLSPTPVSQTKVVRRAVYDLVPPMFEDICADFLTLRQICQRFPDRWVARGKIEGLTKEAFRTATVNAHFATLVEALIERTGCVTYYAGSPLYRFLQARTFYEEGEVSMYDDKTVTALRSDRLIVISAQLEGPSGFARSS